jgi:hypothetical protein
MANNNVKIEGFKFISRNGKPIYIKDFIIWKRLRRGMVEPVFDVEEEDLSAQEHKRLKAHDEVAHEHKHFDLNEYKDEDLNKLGARSFGLST